MNPTAQSCVTAPKKYYSSSTDDTLSPCTLSLLTGAAICGQGERDCKPGQYLEGSECVLVPIGFYNPSQESGIYYVCDGNEYPGAASCDQRFRSNDDVNSNSNCLAGYTFNGTVCEPVPHGPYFTKVLFKFNHINDQAISPHERNPSPITNVPLDIIRWRARPSVIRTTTASNVT